MKTDQEFLKRLKNGAEFADEIRLNKSIVEIAGDNRVLIENHKGIITYAVNQITAKMPFGSITVSGYGLALEQMTKAQLVITGQIASITLNRRNKE